MEDSNINNCSVVGDDDGLCPMIITIPSPCHHHHNNFTLSTQNLSLPHGVPYSSSYSAVSFSAVKAKIMAHPLYQRLLAAYANCQKPKAVAKLEEACASAGIMESERDSGGEDRSLDQFMVAYCKMLTKYKQELAKPFKDAMLFLQRMESQFKTIILSPSDASVFRDAMDRNASSENDVMGYGLIDPLEEDRELRSQLPRKYGRYHGSLKREFMKKRKKGKLPKEVRQQMLDWWTRHYKWPYPSESQKLALMESTRLDQKQINNWFINQRKRHWKLTKGMQFVAMDAAHHHHHHHHYLDKGMGNPFLIDISSPQLL